MWGPPWEERPGQRGALASEGRSPASRLRAASRGPGACLLLPAGGGRLGRGASLVPEGVQPRLFRDEALRTGAGAVLATRRSSLLIAAAPATGLAAPGMVCGEKATEREAQRACRLHGAELPATCPRSCPPLPPGGGGPAEAYFLRTSQSRVGRQWGVMLTANDDGRGSGREGLSGAVPSPGIPRT